MTFLHFSTLFKILRPLNFYRQTPRGLTFPKTAKLSLWAVTARVGRASIVKIVTKTADNLRFSLKKWQREWNFASEKGFMEVGSLLLKNEPSYGSVGIKLPEIIAATLRHLASL